MTMFTPALPTSPRKAAQALVLASCMRGAVTTAPHSHELALHLAKFTDTRAGRYRDSDLVYWGKIDGSEWLVVLVPVENTTTPKETP